MKTISHKSSTREITFKHFAQLILLPALLVAAGCTSSQNNTEAVGAIDPSGSYALTSVDGKPVPCEVQHEGQTLNVVSGSLTINEDGTCASETVFSLVGRGEIHRNVTATYVLEGSTVTLKWEGAGTTTGTIEGDSFTMNNEGMMFSYER